MIIRKARAEDSDRILEIYAPYILNTTITFEYNVPSSADFRRRVEKIMSEYPYYVCEEEGEVLGYCYGSRYMERAAFGWDMELSVYLKDKAKGRGIGKALYGAVIDTAELMNVKNLYGLIAVPNPRSEGLHRDLGFRLETVMKKTGWKFGRWIDLLYLKKVLNPSAEPQLVKNVNDLDPAEIEKILNKYTTYVNKSS